MLEERADPTPTSGELLLRVRACGVCRTDLHVVEGDLETRKLPLVPGHEVVGTVDAIGADVRGFAIGDRVGIAWVRSTCGTCEFCVEGRTNLCESARFTGWTDDGGYAELAVVPAAWAYPIPDVFTDDEAAPLLCAGIIGHRALALSNVQPGERLGLYGFGGSAHIVIQIALARGSTSRRSATSTGSSRASWAPRGSAARTRRLRFLFTARSSSRRRASSFLRRCARCAREAPSRARAST